MHSFFRVGKATVYALAKRANEDWGEAAMVAAFSNFYDFPAEPSAISAGAGLEHPSRSVTPLYKSVTV